MLKTLDLLRSLKKISPKIGFTPIQLLRPYLSGDLYQDCLRHGFKEPKNLEVWKNNLQISLDYLYPKDLPWIKYPESVEVMVKYASKGFNRYLNTLDVNFLLKVASNIRVWIFDNFSYWYLKSNQPLIKKVIKKSLDFTDYSSRIRKKINYFTIQGFKKIIIYFFISNSNFNILAGKICPKNSS